MEERLAAAEGAGAFWDVLVGGANGVEVSEAS